MRLFWKTFYVSLASVTLCTVLLTSLITYLEAAYSLSRLRAQERLLAVTVASQIDVGYREHVWPFEMLGAIGDEPEFVSWQIVDDAGRVVLSDRPVARELNEELRRRAPSPDAPVRVRIGPGTEFWIVPLHVGEGHDTWTFRLGYRTDSVVTQIRGIVVTNALVGFGLAVLLAAASLLVMRQLLRPLDAVTRGARQMAQGDFTEALPDGLVSAAPSGLAAEGGDEIAELVRGFRVMVASVAERDAKIGEHLESLEKARAELESRVEARTSELRRAKAAAEAAASSLQESETRMRGIVEYAADAIVTLDDRGCIEVYNPAAAEVFGYSAQEAIGRPFQSLLAAEYVLSLATVSIDVERGGEHGGRDAAIQSAGEIRGRRKDGTTFPMQYSLSRAQLDERQLFTAIVHDITERRRAQEEVADLHRRLVEASRLAGKAEVASDVLHNVGNILNSVGVSATVLSQKARQTRCESLVKATRLLRDHEGDLTAFLTEDPRGKLLPILLEKLAETMNDEQRSILGELSSLTHDIDHIKAIVVMQQSYARVPVDVTEAIALAEVMDDALRIAGVTSWSPHTDTNTDTDITVKREYAPGVRAVVDRHKVLQILVNLVGNAKQAIQAGAARRGEILARVCMEGPNEVRVEVLDDGVGIPQENMLKIFHFGFTTKPNGHGFGLHGGAVAAKEMGGTLSATSEGPGRGARFALVLPAIPPPRASRGIAQEHLR
jgi:PAS domain S-box-containing protein